MNFSDIVFDLKLPGSGSNTDYNTMVEEWYIEIENNPIPSLELCIETWNNVSLPRLLNQYKQEKIIEVKQIANEIMRLNYDWKIIKQYTAEHYTPEEFFVIKQEMQAVRDKSNQIEQEVLALTTLEEVNNYNINFND